MPRRTDSPRPFPLLLAAAFCLGACGTPDAPEEQGGGAVLLVERKDAMPVLGRLELKDLSVRRASDGETPVEPYVPGAWVGGWFDATGDVVGPKGSAPRGRTLTKGWLELRNRAFYRADEKRTKTAPWIEGWRDDDTGGFFPLSGVVWKAE